MAAARLNWEKERVLVTGATGSVGPAVVEALCKTNAHVLAVARHKPPQGLLPQNAEFIVGDITQPSFVETVMEGISVVFHLAAKLHILDAPQELRPDYERVNVVGTKCLVESARKCAVQRLVFSSTISVYGVSSGEIFDEASPPRPDGLYAESKVSAERIVLEAWRADGESLGCVLRLGAVYGPRVKGNYQRLVRALTQRRFIQIGDGSNRRALIHEKDVAEAALVAARHPEAAGRVFNLSDGQDHTMKEILEAICTALGRKPPRLRLPAQSIRALAGMMETTAGMLGMSFPVRRSTIDKYLEDVAVDSRSIQTLLGFSPQFDLVTGWKETIASMRQTGQI